MAIDSPGLPVRVGRETAGSLAVSEQGGTASEPGKQLLEKPIRVRPTTEGRAICLRSGGRPARSGVRSVLWPGRALSSGSSSSPDTETATQRSRFTEGTEVCHFPPGPAGSEVTGGRPGRTSGDPPSSPPATGRHPGGREGDGGAGARHPEAAGPCQGTGDHHPRSGGSPTKDNSLRDRSPVSLVGQGFPRRLPDKSGRSGGT